MPHLDGDATRILSDAIHEALQTLGLDYDNMPGFNWSVVFKDEDGYRWHGREEGLY